MSDAPPEAGDPSAGSPEAATPLKSTAPRRRRWPWVVGAGVVVIAGGLYATGYAMASDTVPRNASVAGVPLGGLSSQEAEATLTQAMASKVAAPLTVTVGAKTAPLDPVAAGLTLDAAASVRATGTGRSLNPVHIWRVLVSGDDVAPVSTADPTRLGTAVDELAVALDAAPANASVAFDGTKVVVTNAVIGSTLDHTATGEAVSKAFLVSTNVDGVATATDPAITTDAATKAATSFAEPAVSGPITLDTGKGTVQITPEQIAASITFPVDGTAITPTVDYAGLLSAMQPAMKPLGLTDPKDATITNGASGPVITPSSDGEGITKENLQKAVEPLLTQTGARTGPVTLAPEQATFTTEMAQGLGVKEVIGEFTTKFPYAEYRNNNLSLAAAGINNTLLKPGDTFSLNKTLGERTAANGYMEGYVIQDGALVKEVGGGVSQSATTTFNAAFFAGFKDVEHHPHTLFFDRYPAGREATVYYGSLDLRFQNDTQYGALMQAFVTKASPGGSGSITVRVWSTKTWDEVRSSDLVKSNFTNGASRTETGPNCQSQAAAQGFDVNYSRLFIKGGQVARTENFFWRYSPADKITCQ